MNKRRPIVIVESPYAGNVERNTAYARACLRHSLLQGEAPTASHLLYTQPGVLDDDNPIERQIGMDAGLEMCRIADFTAVYTDFGISEGMRYGIVKAQAAGLRIEYRKLPKE